jgi:hypothetical protein
MTLLVLMLFNPRQAFARIRLTSPWAVALFTVVVAAGILLVLQHPFLAERTLANLPRSASATDKDAVRVYLEQDLVALLAFSPVRIGGGIAVFAFTLQLLCRSLAPFSRIPFRVVFSLLVHAECVYILAGAAGLAAAAIAPVQGPTPGTPLSLVGIAGDQVDFSLRALLHSLNIFTLWYLTLVGSGIISLLDMNRWKAAAAVVIVWGLSQLISLASLSFVRDTLHLLL